MKTKTFALSILSAVALPLLVQAEPEATPGKQSTTTSVPQTTAPVTSDSKPEAESAKVPGKTSTTTAVPMPAKESDATPKNLSNQGGSTTATVPTPAK